MVLQHIILNIEQMLDVKDKFDRKHAGFSFHYILENKLQLASFGPRTSWLQRSMHARSGQRSDSVTTPWLQDDAQQANSRGKQLKWLHKRSTILGPDEFGVQAPDRPQGTSMYKQSVIWRTVFSDEVYIIPNHKVMTVHTIHFRDTVETLYSKEAC